MLLPHKKQQMYTKTIRKGGKTMGIIEYLKNLFKSDKKNATLYTIALKKEYDEKTPLEIGLYDGKNPIIGEDIGIEVNNKQYIRTTDTDGIAKLNINLPVGKYSPKIYWRGNKEYNKTTAYTDIIISTPTYMEGIDLTKNEGDADQYQCAVYRKDNNQRVKDTVKITINGVGYVREADHEGLYKLNINLNQGTYPIKAEYKGNQLYKPSTTNNTITIKEKPKPVETPKVEPQKSRSEKILDTFESYFGECQYIDDALSKIQGNGYSFYFSDGYNMYDTIVRIYNGDGANCYDSAELFYHLMLGMNTKYGRNYEPQYLHVWCPSSGYDHIRLRFKSNGQGWYYRDPASVLSGNGVESNWCGTSSNILEIDPSFILDG